MDLRQVQKLIKFFQDELDDVSLQQLMTLFYIINNEGCPQVEIANALNMPEPTVSRNITKLGAKKVRVRSKDGQAQFKEGRGLLTKGVVDSWDVRRNAISLSKKGEGFKYRLEQLLKEID